jgi:hypothetical protein
MKNSTLAFALAALALSSGICVAQEADIRRAAPPSKPASLKCCECIAGASNVVAPLDLSTGQTGPVKWTVDGGPVYVTLPYSSWLTSPPAQWVQSVNSPSPGDVGAGPFTYGTLFNVPKCAIPYSMVQLSGTYAADNGATISLVPGASGTPCPGQYCFQAPGKTFTFSPVAPGAHTLRVVVTNQPGTVSGLLVNAKLEARCPVCLDILNLPMQGGNEHTPCPGLGVVYTRAQAPSVPYLQIMLPNLDQQCATKGPGVKMLSIKFKTCCADPRGPGFGPNATADLTCG